MTVREAIAYAEARFWVVAVLVMVVGMTQSHHLPVWANGCLVVSFLVASKTPRALKEACPQEDA